MNLTRAIAVYLRYYYISKKGINQLCDLFYWPIVDIFLWGLTSVWITSQNPSQNLSLVLLTGLVLWQIVWRGSVDIAISLLQELWQRNLVNLFSTPLKVSEWLIGVVLLSINKLIVTIGYGALCVYLFYDINVFTIGWLFIPFSILLVTFGWSISLISGSLIVYLGQKVEMFAWMTAFLFAPFSAIFYPVSILPPWAQTISWWLPTTYVFEATRLIISGETCPLSYLVLSGCLNLCYLIGSLYMFKYFFEKSRIKGLARLE